MDTSIGAEIKSSKTINTTNIQAKSCNGSYFADIDNHFNKDLLKTFKCPMEGYDFEIKGDLTSGSTKWAIAYMSLCR